MEREQIIDEIKNYMRENTEMGWVNADEVMRKVNEIIPSRLVPDGTVVLTKEEYYDLKNKVKWAKELGVSADKIQKKTAKTIYEKAKKKKYIDNDDEGCYWGAITLDDLADICGVEAEE